MNAPDLGVITPSNAGLVVSDRIAELEAAVQAGRDLMAIVHGDGGHYREAHGDRKAADDAIAIVINLRAELAAERERRASAEMALAGWRRWARSACARYEKD